MTYLPSGPNNYIYAFIGVVLMIQGLAGMLYLSQLKNKSRATWYLLQFFNALVAGSLTMFFANIVMLWRPVLLPFQDVFIIFGGIALVELAYNFPEHNQPREATWVVGVIAALAVGATVYSLVFAYRYLFNRTSALDVNRYYYILMPLSTVILVGAFVRRAVHYTPSTSSNGHTSLLRRIWQALLHPPNKPARALRGYAFALVPGLLPGIGALVSLSPDLTVYLVGAGGVLTVTLLTVTHINRGPEPTSFIVKLVGISLMTFLMLFGIFGLNILHNEAALQREIHLVDGQSPRHLYNQAVHLIGQLVIGSAVLVLILPAFFRANLLRPLERLLEGVKQANAGDLKVHIPVQYEDEIGLLTRSFNNVIAWLRTSNARKDELNTALQETNADLEQRVQARTAELTRVNAQLQEDITAREQAEQALRASEAQYRTLVETTDAILWKMDVATRKFTYMSQQVARILGYPAETWIDFDTWASRIHPDDRENAVCYCSTATERGEDHDFDYRVITADGRTVWIRDVVTVVMGENGPQELVGFLLDVTKEKEAASALRQAKEAAEAAGEKARAASEAKSVFLANMSHELRTPLNGVLGYAQILLRDQGLSARQYEAVQAIQRSGEHLLTLINDILDISKIEAGGLEIVATEFHLPQLLENLTDVLRIQAEQKDIGFVYKAVSDLPIGVKGDARRLRQVLVNLLGNAIKFTEHGSVTFMVAHQNGRLQCQIEDTGIGIAPDVLAEAFAPFRQTGDRERAVPGMGLGLPISRRLIELMGGELHVQSEPGQGSTFWFDLELPAAPGWTAIPASEPALITGYKEPQKKILVVDDSLANRTVAVEMLSPLGFEVREAVDGADAVAQAQTFRPDVILMDLVMPHMDGLEATRQIRALPALKDTAIVAVSASAFDEDRERSRQAGCDNFLAKPFRLERLLDMLQTYLGLTWQSQSVADAIVSSSTPAVIVPARPILENLFRLALTGKIVELRTALAELAEEKAAYSPFVAEIGKLVQNVKLSAVRKRLRAYLESAE